MPLHFMPVLYQRCPTEEDEIESLVMRDASIVALVTVATVFTMLGWVSWLLAWQGQEVRTVINESVARMPYDPVLGSLWCLEDRLNDTQLDVLNFNVFQELDLQLEAKRCPLGDGREVLIHPIVFGAPAENVVSCATVKLRDYASVIAGRTETYVFRPDNEAEYVHSYRMSRFVHTKKKAGWDCARHWEILSAGSVPFFVDIEASPEHTLAHLPRSLMLEARHFPGTHYDPTTQLVSIDHSVFDENKYQVLQQRILHLTRRRLTTEAIARDMMRRVGKSAEDLRSVLLMGCMEGGAQVDYMDVFVTHGWIQALGGDRVTVMAPNPALFRWSPPNETVPWDEASIKKAYGGDGLYGMGYSYGRRLYAHRERLEHDLRLYASEEGRRALQTKIDAHEFDLVVYTCSHRGMLWQDKVLQKYAPHEVLVVDGNDEAPDRSGRRRRLAAQSTFFLREIPDDCLSV